jgi:hypothetical protein
MRDKSPPLVPGERTGTKRDLWSRVVLPPETKGCTSRNPLRTPFSLGWYYHPGLKLFLKNKNKNLPLPVSPFDPHPHSHLYPLIYCADTSQFLNNKKQLTLHKLFHKLRYVQLTSTGTNLFPQSQTNQAQHMNSLSHLQTRFRTEITNRIT